MRVYTLTYISVATILIGAFSQATASAGEVRGRIVDRSSTIEQSSPPSSEADISKLAAASGLAGSDVRLMREATSKFPSTAPRFTSVMRDEKKTPLFESGSAVMTTAVRQHLDELVRDLMGKRNIMIAITGHTDNQRISSRLQSQFADNQALSEARALVVAAYFKTVLKLDATQFAIAGKGEGSPVADNTTEDGRAANRRVEIQVWYDELKETPRGVEALPLCSSSELSSQVPFNITIDGVPQEQEKGRTEADRQRCADIALEKADIRIHYDPLAIAPSLNVWTAPNGALRSLPVSFYTYSNYTFWIKRAEVRIFEKGRSSQQQPYAVIPVTINEFGSWQAPAAAPDRLFFLLRVYDEQGRFDETAAKELTLLAARKSQKDEESLARERLIGYGENSRVLANIPAQGGTITIDGAKIQSGHSVTALGIPAPVDRTGKFALRQIMPAGPHTVEVSVLDAKGHGMVYRRNISIPDQGWFYVAIGDLTVGQNSTSGPAQLVMNDDTHHYDNKAYIDGRGAFYLKGKIKGDYLLTMSADTRERPVRDLFSNFDSKDPGYLLRRIDPDRYYPVYGDDSTTVDDAPTQGKFYVKIEKGDSSIMWGNFQTQWTGTELTQYSRGLYGANLVVNPQAVTKYGERRTALNAFAAEPGTLSSREEFRGTGGSLYYLQHMDITQGSDRIWVEIRDKDSGIVLERHQLAPAQDYDINYVQGRVVLRSPLPSVADGSTLVQTSILNGNPVFLVVSYEYVPGMTEISGLAGGVRATHWLTDYLRIGITGYRQGEAQSRQYLEGGDLILRYKPGTYLKGEFGRSEGAGVGTQTSITGGFGFNTLQGNDSDHANAWRVEGAVDFSEVREGSKGKINAYWQNRDRGFSSPGQVTLDAERMEQVGLAAQMPIGDRATVSVKADNRDSDSQVFRAGEASAAYRATNSVTVSGGVRADDRNVKVPNASQALSEDGERVDAIARIDYRPLAKKKSEPVASKPIADAGKDQAQPTDKPAELATQATTTMTAVSSAPTSTAPQYAPWGLFAYGQGTLTRSGSRSENDRIGAGANWQMTPRFKVEGEASTGSGGLGGKLSGDYRIDDRSNVYLTYINETDRPELAYRGRIGTFVLGSGYKVSDQTRVYTESRWVNGAGPESLVQAFGLDMAPNDRWTYGIKGEIGEVSDEVSGDLKRYALGMSLAYKFEGLKYASALEYRHESGNLEKRETWLMKNSVGYQATRSVRLLGKYNFSYSDSSLGNFYDGNYTELVAGAAYRPVQHDKLNTLFKYTYFANVPSPGQFTATNVVADYSQRSHVLSVDAIYDLVSWLSIGAKYGLRIGELKMTKTDGEWFSSRADLIVVRADFHLVREWDAIVEGRRLKVYEADDERMGFLVGVYRYVTDNVKIGAGYNFTNFSDNLTDLSYRNRGWFVNLIAAF
jgi:outer membrane protein OmpA-like peptidoglycan-associated protein